MLILIGPLQFVLSNINLVLFGTKLVWLNLLIICLCRISFREKSNICGCNEAGTIWGISALTYDLFLWILSCSEVSFKIVIAFWELTVCVLLRWQALHLWHLLFKIRDCFHASWYVSSPPSRSLFSFPTSTMRAVYSSTRKQRRWIKRRRRGFWKIPEYIDGLGQLLQK